MLYIYSTFTAQPLQLSLTYLLDKFSQTNISFQYGNLFPTLLDQQSDFYRRTDAYNFILVRMSDLGKADTECDLELLKKNIKELIVFLQKASLELKHEIVLLLCPSDAEETYQQDQIYYDAEKYLEQQLTNTTSLKLITYNDIEKQYPCSDIFNPLSDLQGHIPYTTDYFTALGATMARYYHSQWVKPFKVIVVDCDGTLWNGVVEEEGISGIKIDEVHKALQKFLINQQEKGMLVCLCSKNREEIVLQAFREHPDMQLDLEKHIVDYQINWDSKSDNIRILAERLNLGLESFIFIDNEPMECAEVQANCPGVLTLCLPFTPNAIMPFIENVWVFDAKSATNVGENRTQLYKQEQKRVRLKKEIGENRFIKELELKVDIKSVEPPDYVRIVELTERTNQFNLSGSKKSISELKRLHETHEQCLSIHVRDRFGDYGLSGAVFFHINNDELTINNFLLSCRVLSRGVEFNVLKWLSEKMLELNCNKLVFVFKETEKNLPAKCFLSRLSGSSDEIDSRISLTQHDIANIEYHCTTDKVQPTIDKAEGSSAHALLNHPSEYLIDVAKYCQTIAQIIKQMECKKIELYVDPEISRNPVVKTLVDLCRQIMKQPIKLTSESLIAQGLDSIQAVQLVGAIYSEFQVGLNYIDLLREGVSLRQVAMKIVEYHSQKKHAKFLMTPIDDFDKRENSNTLPLSQPQLRLWVDESVNESTKAKNNMIIAYELHGNVNVECLQKAIDELVHRHESLRTTFHLEEDSLYQVIHDPSPVKIRKDYINDLKIIEQYITQLSTKPFQLDQYPLFRINLIQKSKTHMILVLCIHHIVSDGWSLNIMLKELNSLYNAFCENEGSPLPPVRMQYKDYIRMQQQNNKSVKIKRKSREFWAKYLDDLPVVNLPTDMHVTQALSNEGKHVSFSITQEHTEALKEIAKQKGITLYNLMIATYATLISLYCSQTDVGIITASAGRQYPGTTDVLGFFVNMVVARYRFDKKFTFSENLPRNQAFLNDVMAYQEIPFSEILEMLKINQYNSHRQHLQTAFIFQNYNTHALNLTGVDAKRGYADNQSLLYDNSDQCRFGYLTCYMQERNGQLEGIFEYNASLFYQETIKQLAECFNTVIEQIINLPNQNLEEYNLLSHARQEQLLTKWNPPYFDYFPEKTLIHYFLEQVKTHPNKIAIRHGDKQLSYRELDKKSNQFARYLMSNGLGRERFAAFCLERSVASIITMLAICKIGATYIPLDPKVPIQRNRTILEDAYPSLVIVEEKDYESFDEFINTRNLLAYDEELYGKFESDDLPLNGTIDMPAYMMYTSGTTGKPKGVLIPQSGIIRLVINPNYIELTANDVIAQASNIAFDAATFEIWGALLNGSKLVVIDHNDILNPENLSQVLQKEHVTILWLTAQLFHMYALECPDIFENLTYLLSGGDKIYPDAVGRVFRIKNPPKYFINGYGPTENTTFSTTYKLPSSCSFCSIMPIGQPINNTNIYILNDSKKPVPIGVPGRLYVSGDGVGKYYMQGMQAQNSFIANPFLTESDREKRKNLILYDTGDLAYWDHDGFVHHIGRSDLQVKINGFRIELTEIEENICFYPQIQQAVVMMEQKDGLEKKLIAFVSVEEKCILQVNCLVDFLREKLPTYMIPSVYYSIDKFPINANGKIDRQKLKSMNLTPHHMISEDNNEKPVTLIQKRLARLYEDLLDLPKGKVTLNDDFFSLGGNSISTIKLGQKIKMQFKVELLLSQLYQKLTIKYLSTLIESKLETTTLDSKTIFQNSLIQLRTGNTNKIPIVFIHPIGGTGFCYKDLIENMDLQTPCYLIQDPSILAEENLFDSIEIMAKEYLNLLFEQFGNKNFVLAGYSFGGMISLEMAHQMEIMGKGKQLQFVALFDTWVMSAVDEKARSLLKKAMLEKFDSVKEILVNEEGLDKKIWIEINYHRMQQMGFVYKPPVLDSKLILFKAAEQYEEFEQMKHSYNYLDQYAKQEVSVHTVSGSHETILQSGNARTMAQLLEKELNKNCQSSYKYVNNENQLKIQTRTANGFNIGYNQSSSP